VLVGDEAFIECVRRTRKLFGGGMRQAGIIAAPGLLALENRGHLDADHRRAERIAEGLGGIDGIEATEPDSNIVVVDVAGTGLNAEEFVGEIEQHGVLAVAFGETTVRFTTNWDVSDGDVEGAIDSVRAAVAEV
jgi:threonine aldolase